MYAAQYGHSDCARLLIDAGADKDAKNNVRRRLLTCCYKLLALFIFFLFFCVSNQSYLSIVLSVSLSLHTSAIQVHHDLSQSRPKIIFSTFIFIFSMASDLYPSLSIFSLCRLITLCICRILLFVSTPILYICMSLCQYLSLSIPCSTFFPFILMHLSPLHHFKSLLLISLFLLLNCLNLLVLPQIFHQMHCVARGCAHFDQHWLSLQCVCYDLCDGVGVATVWLVTNLTHRADGRRSFKPLYMVTRSVRGCWSMPAPTRRSRIMCVIGRCFSEALHVLLLLFNSITFLFLSSTSSSVIVIPHLYVQWCSVSFFRRV